VAAAFQQQYKRRSAASLSVARNHLAEPRAARRLCNKRARDRADLAAGSCRQATASRPQPAAVDRSADGGHRLDSAHRHTGAAWPVPFLRPRARAAFGVQRRRRAGSRGVGLAAPCRWPQRHALRNPPAGPDLDRRARLAALAGKQCSATSARLELANKFAAAKDKARRPTNASPGRARKRGAYCAHVRSALATRPGRPPPRPAFLARTMRRP
jgi:hypothetical protein